MVHGGVLGSIGDVHDCEPIRIGKLNVLGAFPGARTEWGRGQHTAQQRGGRLWDIGRVIFDARLDYDG